MNLVVLLRRYWQEILLVLLVTLPWLSLLVLGIVWLWQGGHVAIWALTAAVLGLLAWPLARSVRWRANTEARHALGELAEPARSWNAVERDAWSEVLAIADATAPFSFLELDPLFIRARETVEAVARRLHPHARSAWSQFSFPEVLLLTERLSRDVRREALRHIPGIRAIRLSHVMWVQQQTEQYGPVAQKGWRVGFGLWRLARAILNPIQAVGQETSGFVVEKTASVLSYRLRAYATRLLVLEVGRAAIDLYSGRLVLSDDEIRAAQDRDLAAAESPTPMPVRVLLVGQVSAGKSSLVNAMSHAVRAAVGPLPTTAHVSEHRLELEGRPAVTLVDMAGLDEHLAKPDELLREAARADLIVWVASATQPARAPDRNGIDTVRAWAKAQLARRPPSILLALTHVDQLRPAQSGHRPTTSPHLPGRRRGPSVLPWMPPALRSIFPPTRSCRSPCRPAASPTTSTRSGRAWPWRSTKRSSCSSIGCVSDAITWTCASLRLSSEMLAAWSSGDLRGRDCARWDRRTGPRWSTN
jgi:hypothetical protein